MTIPSEPLSLIIPPLDLYLPFLISGFETCDRGSDSARPGPGPCQRSHARTQTDYLPDALATQCEQPPGPPLDVVSKQPSVIFGLVHLQLQVLSICPNVAWQQNLLKLFNQATSPAPAFGIAQAPK